MENKFHTEPEVEVTDCPITMTLGEYKQFIAAEVILRVLLASDIGTYGANTSIVDAARKVYGEVAGVEEPEENNAE